MIALGYLLGDFGDSIGGKKTFASSTGGAAGRAFTAGILSLALDVSLGLFSGSELVGGAGCCFVAAPFLMSSSAVDLNLRGNGKWLANCMMRFE